jgi:Leucine-rich repeat (LRR) protein
MLSCEHNQLTSLDVSNNTELTELSCGNNRLTSLDISNNTALTRLDYESNQLTSLDVSNCTVLEYLYCERNNLNAAALNDMFETLPDRQDTGGEISIEDNPGSNDCNRNIAENKGWFIRD